MDSSNLPRTEYFDISSGQAGKRSRIGKVDGGQDRE
jgi:hypothetical protein